MAKEKPQTFVEAVAQMREYMRETAIALGFKPADDSAWSLVAAALRTPLGWVWLVCLGFGVGFTLGAFV